jgi:hypothetical protein
VLGELLGTPHSLTKLCLGTAPFLFIVSLGIPFQGKRKIYSWRDSFTNMFNILFRSSEWKRKKEWKIITLKHYIAVSADATARGGGQWSTLYTTKIGFRKAFSLPTNCKHNGTHFSLKQCGNCV